MHPARSVHFAAFAALLALAGPALAQPSQPFSEDYPKSTPNNVRPFEPCQDIWITAAYYHATGGSAIAPTIRGPIGYGDSGECNHRLYGGGSWSSFDDLVAKIGQYLQSTQWGVCRDAWVTQAVTQAKEALGIRTGTYPGPHAPAGYAETGECDMYLYSNGNWSSYDELYANVYATLSAWKAEGMGLDASGNFVRGAYDGDGALSGTALIPAGQMLVVPQGSLDHAKAAGVVAVGGANLVGLNGSNLVGLNGSNIVAVGGANVIAMGGANVIANGGMN